MSLKFSTKQRPLVSPCQSGFQAQVEAKTRALEEAAQSLLAAANAGHSAGPGPEAAAAGGAAHDDVVDAEFTEVKDDGNKQ